MHYAQVALDVAVLGALTYAIPAHVEGKVRPGQLVEVPFRSRSKIGLVMSVDDCSSYDGEPRPLVDLVGHEPLLDDDAISFLRFVADYYMSPLGNVMRLAIPAAVRTEGMKWYRRVPSFDPKAVPAQLQLLFASMGVEPVEVSALRASSGFTYAELAELETAGAVDVSYEAQEAVKIKTDSFYRLVSGAQPPARLGSKQRALLDEIADASPGDISLADLRTAHGNVRPSLKRLLEHGLVAVQEREVYRDPFADEAPAAPVDAPLTPAQTDAVHAITRRTDEGRFGAFLLHGVTGSGKTRVYVEAIAHALQAGRTALVLLPEIALTPQFVAVFRGHFDGRIAVLHSGLTAAQRFDEWRRIKRGEVSIVIGARSALFAPLTDLGVIIVDEEHDASFKQEEGTRYNARDMAIVRAKLSNACAVLGSATPSLETFHNAREGRFQLLSMPNRVARRPLPNVTLVDLRDRDRSSARSDLLTDGLLDAMESTVGTDRQVILFLNRRGFSPCVICEVCGHIWRCPNCDVSLTYHRRQESLRCHHCDHSVRLPERCPECENQGVGPRGVGTEQLESHVRGLFPDARCARLDRDTSSGTKLRNLIRRFGDREIDILVGTQMVTKGHDFPGVTTVGVVSADQSLNFPDFRGAERTFQLLTQVAGRAGRGDDSGHVFVQSYDPEHFALRAAQEHDYDTFADAELRRRALFSYPPFGYLIAMKFEARAESAVAQTARSYHHAARRRLRRTEDDWGDTRVKGPAPAPFERLRGKIRWQLLFQGTDRNRLRRLVAAVLHDVGHFEPDKRPAARVVVDVDPLNLL